MGSLEKRIVDVALTAIRARRDATSSPGTDGQLPSAVASSPAKVREARFSDFEAVAELKRRFELAADSFENWERLWRYNPALEQTPHQYPIGWVLEADGKVVGYIGNILQLYRYQDRTLISAVAHGLVVEHQYRAFGVSLVAAYFRQKNIDLFMSTGAIAPVGKMARAFKSDVLPHADYETVLFWVLRPHPFARAVMNKLGVKPALSGIGSAFASLFVWVDTHLRRRWPKPSSSDLQVSEIRLHEIGNDFQELWLERVGQGLQLLADRDLSTLRWHFETPGDKGDTRVLRCTRNAQLLGYAIVRDEPADETGMRKSTIADLLVRQDDTAVMHELLVAAYAHAKQSGSHILEVLGLPPAIRNLWAQCRPYTRKYPTPIFGYKAVDPELHKAIATGNTWYATPFDGDFTLIRPSYSNHRPSTPSPKMQPLLAEEHALSGEPQA